MRRLFIYCYEIFVDMPKQYRVVFLIPLFIAITIVGFVLICPQNCRPVASPLNAIGKFSTLIDRTEAYNIYQFNADFRWDGTAYVQEKKDSSIRVAIPKGKVIDMSKIYEISAQEVAPKIRLSGISGIMYSTVYKLYYADAVEEYDEIAFNHNSFYNYCWEYDCASKSLPFPKIERPIRRLFLSGKDSGSFFKGVRVDKIFPAKGNITVAIVFVYDASPVPEEKLSSLKGITNNTNDDSFAHVAEWYKERADETFQRNDTINMSITFFDTQLKAQIELQERGDASCANMDFRELILTQLPEAKKYDVLVQFYYTSDTNNTIKCSPHPAGRDSIFLYANPATLDSSYYGTLVVSFAHELAHLFGASDRYTTEISDYTAGCLVESDDPMKVGRDIMCHRVPEYKNSSLTGFINPPLGNLTITEVTAKEIGWYDFDEDGIFEVEDPCPWDVSNRCIL